MSTSCCHLPRFFAQLLSPSSRSRKKSDVRLSPLKLSQLQTELRDLAFRLDTRGNPEAADVATTVANRLEEFLLEARSR